MNLSTGSFIIILFTLVFSTATRFADASVKTEFKTFSSLDFSWICSKYKALLIS